MEGNGKRREVARVVALKRAWIPMVREPDIRIQQIIDLT